MMNRIVTLFAFLFALALVAGNANAQSAVPQRIDCTAPGNSPCTATVTMPGGMVYRVDASGTAASAPEPAAPAPSAARTQGAQFPAALPVPPTDKPQAFCTDEGCVMFRTMYVRTPPPVTIELDQCLGGLCGEKQSDVKFPAPATSGSSIPWWGWVLIALGVLVAALAWRSQRQAAQYRRTTT